MIPGIFLDRDGVIIENRAEYVRSWDDVHIYPQALTALAKIRNLPLRIVIVTNQSAIGRGIITHNQATEINQRLLYEIHKTGGRIDKVYMCPHAPRDNCECRKPRPGLVYQAARELDIELTRSILIGDTLTDLQAGIAANLKRVALVKTGRGETQMNLPEARALPPFPIYSDLMEALSVLVVKLL
ncbi:MAG: HAD family hydrolase [Chloroflexota bacterium]